MLAKGVSMLDGGRSPMLSAIFRAVIAHGGLVEQADDCTQLVVRYNGGGVREDAPDVRRASRSFPSSQEGVASASGFLDGVLATEGEAIEMLSPKLHIILDEIASNIAKHSGASSFDIEIVCSPGGVKLTFSDDGAAYDPLMHSDPDVSLPAEERPIGGLGILMVKKMATDILYRREGGRNVLAVALASPRRDMI